MTRHRYVPAKGGHANETEQSALGSPMVHLRRALRHHFSALFANHRQESTDLDLEDKSTNPSIHFVKCRLLCAMHPIENYKAVVRRLRLAPH